MRDKFTTAAEAMSEVRDGALVAFNFWGPGTPLHLMRALQERGVKDLTICTNNYTLRADILREQGAVDAAILLPQTKKIIVAFSGVQQEDSSASVEIARRVQEGTLEIENVSHGLFIERIEAGAMHLGGIYSPIGIGTSLEVGKEKRVINGVEYLFQEPIVPDLGLINAAKADKLGNLVCHGTARAANPIIAMASRYTIAEVFEVVEPGELDPDAIVIPAAFVDRIVRIPDDDPYGKEQRVEQTLHSVKYRLQKMAEAEAEAEAARGGRA